MATSERLLGIVKDVVLPADFRTRYDVYFTDRRVAIVCLGRAERFESETEQPLSIMPSAFGIPAPIGSSAGKQQDKESIDEKIRDWALRRRFEAQQKKLHLHEPRNRRHQTCLGKNTQIRDTKQGLRIQICPQRRTVPAAIEDNSDG